MKQLLHRRRNELAISAVLFAVGVLFDSQPIGDALSRVSYDLSVITCRPATPQAMIVYLDDESARELGQPSNAPWDRRLHAQLLDRLTADGAGLVVYDILFQDPSGDAAADGALAQAIRRNGKVTLGGTLEASQPYGLVDQQSNAAPLSVFAEAAAGWGLLSLDAEADYAVRRLFVGADIPSSAAVAARLLGQTHFPRRPAWLQYYSQGRSGERDPFPGLGFADALTAPPGLFRDQIVFVGGRFELGKLGADRFAGPWTRLRKRYLNGVEVHATALVNLLHHEWLERPPLWIEVGFLFAASLFAGIMLNRQAPREAAFYSLGATIVLVPLGLCSPFLFRVWAPWAIPVAVQIPLGLVWSVGNQYYAANRRRKKLRDAFSLYLSPHMADQIADTDFDLTPGGKTVEVSVLFTDLEGFTKLSEDLDDPAKLSRILIEYFGRTTKCILDNEGTILKYLGDAVEAVWGAPLAEQDHAYRAALAAYQLRQVARFETQGRTVRTRVGLNSGPVFAGNLGSYLRFDYAVIGDTTNFAARLESLNKRFGTDILISETTFEKLRGRFITRPLGRYRVVGKQRAVGIHELISPTFDGTPFPWLSVFAEGLAAFTRGDFAPARVAFEEVRRLRDGADGPSDFLLQAIEKLVREGVRPDWDGVLEFDSK